MARSLRSVIRSVRHLRTLGTAGAIALAAGQATAAVFTWTPTSCAGLNWTTQCSTLNGCGAGNTLFRNNWNQTGCNVAPLFPGAADDVVIGVSGMTIDGSQSVRSVTINSGVSVGMVANMSTSAGFTNNGSLSTSGAGSINYGGTFTNAAGATWLENSNTRFWGSTTFNNAGTLELRSITLAANGGVNAINNTGTLLKSTASTASQNFALSNSGTINITGGTYSLNGTTYTGTPTSVVQVAGTGGAAFDLNGVTLSGRLNGTGAGEINTTGTLTISGAVTTNVASNLRVFSSISVPAGSSLTNTGDLTTSGAGNINYSGSITNASTGTWVENSNTRFWASTTFTNQGLLELQSIALSANGGANALNNSGTVRKTTVSAASINFPVSNSGTIDVQAGTLTLSGSTYTGTATGNLNVATGATTQFTGMTLAGTVNFSGAGTLQSVGSLGVAGAVTLNTTSPFRILSDVTVGGANSLTNAGNVSTSGAGNLNYAGTLTNGATGTWIENSNNRFLGGSSFVNNGVWELQSINFSANGGTNSHVNNATLRKTTASSAASNIPFLNNGLVDVQAGSLDWSGTTYTGIPTANIAVATGAEVNLTNMTLAGTVRCSGLGTISTIGGLTVAGNVTTNTTAALSVRSNVTVTAGNSLTNQGLLSTSGAGNINYTGPLTNGVNGTWIENSNTRFFGSASLTNNGILDLRSISLAANGGTNTLTNNATLRKTTASTASINFPFVNNASIDALGGTFDINSTSYTGNGGATISIAAPATVALNSATLVGTFRTTGTGTAEATGTLTASGNATINTQQTMRIVSNISASGAGNSLTNAGNASTSGAGNLNYGGTINNAAGATWVENSNARFWANATFNNAGTLELQSINLAANGGVNTLNNTGVVRKTGVATATSNVTVSNAGLLDVEAGTYNMNGAFSQTASNAITRVRSGSSLGGAALTFAGGSVQGRGTISPAVSITGARLNPGDPVLGGTLSFGSTLALSAASTTQIDIGAPSSVPFDRVQAAGNVVVGGTLVVNVISPFYPILGDVYEIVRSTAAGPNARTGTFANVVVNTDPGIAFAVSYTSNSVLLTVTDTTCDPIDFNRDGLFPDDADLLDFLSVLAGGSCSTDPTPGCADIDFNNDGLFPDDTDLVSFLTVLAGGGC